MDDRKMEIISQLMEQLQEEMQYGESDLGERLGRQKPDVEMVSVEESVEPELEDEIEIEESPEDKLKNRILKLRG